MDGPDSKPLPTFFERHGLSASDLQTCLGFIQDSFPGFLVDDVEKQGGCSWTLTVRRRKPCPTTDDEHGGETRESEHNVSRNDGRWIVQIRPLRHAISPSMSRDAKLWYGDLAPNFEELGILTVGSEAAEIQVGKMSVVPGSRLDAVLTTTMDDSTRPKYKALVESLAEFYAEAWHRGVESMRQHGSRLACTGKIGSTILERLGMLEVGLPHESFRAIARQCKTDVLNGMLDRLPVVVTHGDLLPSNIMVDGRTWNVSGFVDWAEAEYLPFGMSLYSLHHILGSLRKGPGRPRVRFEQTAEAVYYGYIFWSTLWDRAPALFDAETSKAVYLARDVGILLWHGIAWDDGRLDRVVEEGRDDEELAYLYAMLPCRDVKSVL